MANKTVCIEREYGSNGKNIAEWLARSTGIACYDKEALRRVAREKGLAKPDIEDEEERELEAVREAVRLLADGGSCIFVGTCAGSVLQGRPRNINVFVKADEESKLQWAMESEKVSREKAKELLAEMDKRREDNRKNHAVTESGEPVVYDLVVASSTFGIEGTAEIIKKSLSRI